MRRHSCMILMLTAMLFLSYRSHGEAIKGPLLKVLAFSDTVRHVALEDRDFPDATGAAPGGRILIVDIQSREVAEEIVIANRQPEGLTNEQIRTENKKLYEKGIGELKKRGYVFSVPSESLPESMHLTFAADTDDENEDYKKYFIKVFMNGTGTAYKQELNPFYLSHFSLEGFGIEKSFSYSPDGKSFVGFFIRHPVMEFDAPVRVALFFDGPNMSFFFNKVGFEYYKQKKYKIARDNFLLSHFHDSNNMKAVYNTACMYALMDNAQKSIEYLQILKSFNTRGAWQFLNQVKKDGDYNKIRQNPKFKEFIDSL